MNLLDDFFPCGFVGFLFAVVCVVAFLLLVALFGTA